MHFLSSGRDDRIRRWIATQYPQLQGKSENDSSARWQDSLESVNRKDHDAIVDMDWELEELERQMALTAYASRRLSVDTAKQSLDLVSQKRASQVTVKAQEIGGEVVAKDETKFKSPSSALDRRREGRIISQPPALPSELQEVELPRPSLQRSRTVPPPISTSGSARTSNASTAGPPITFILQESTSPLPSAMHFTPTPMDLDAFPSTPRSFSSFALASRSSENPEESQPEMYLSPRLQENRLVETLLTPSPTTPYSFYTSASDISTPSLSAFPATPISLYPHPAHRASGFPFPASKATADNPEAIPPVPALPFLKHSITAPVLPLNRDKALPPSPTSDDASPRSRTPRASKPSTPPASSSSSPTSPSTEDDDTALSESEMSVDGRLSSRFSVLSSRFSVSSAGSGRKASSSYWGSMRARAYSTAGTHSRTTSRAGTHSRATSRAGTHSRAGSTTQTIPHLPQLPLPSTQDHDQAQPYTPASTPPPPPTASVRTLMRSVSRIGMGLKRSKSQSAVSKPKLTIHTHVPSSSTCAPRLVVDRGGYASGDGLERKPKKPDTAPGTKTKRTCVPMTPSTPVGIAPAFVPLPPTPALAGPSPSPKTPVTPTSAAGSFFGAADLSRKQRLIVRGVRRDEGCEEVVRRWCGKIGAVKYIGRVPGSDDINVRFRDKEAYKRTGRLETTHQVDIPDVGTVTLTWVRGSTHCKR